MPDTAPSRLVSLTTPTVLNLDEERVQAIFSASVSDPDGVRQVTVYYDRPLAAQYGPYDFQIIHGYGNDWADGSHSYTAQILPHNIAGTVNITHVQIEDNLGNKTIVSAQELRNLGVDTSITVRSTSADTTAPTLTTLEIPDRVDLANGHGVASFSAAALDANEIDSVAIWFDRNMSYSFGTGPNPSFYTFPLTGIYGSSSNDWSDGNSSQNILISTENLPGTVGITRVVVSDLYGNARTYSASELRAMGFDTSFDLISGAAPTLTTYVADLPDTITIREGQNVDVALNFVGMTNHWVNYSYYTSTSGGTASSADIGAVSGSGSMSVSSSFPSNYNRSFTISATRDGIQENTETAYLVVELGGNMTFADGTRTQVVEIRIADDNRTAGGAGNDILYGTSAAESLTGSAGNDSYHVTAGDRVIETANGGIDTVYSNFSRALEANVENLVLTGTASINATGNALANRLTGNAGANVLNGGTGADTMTGGAGNDTYIVDNARDTVVEGWNGGTDTVRSTVGWTLGANFENLILLGGSSLNATGNALANRLTGNAGGNLLDGGAGADTMAGGAGNDTYVVDNAGDRLIEGLNGGTDTVRSTVSLVLGANLENLTLLGGGINGTGNGLANRLTGNGANNTLSGNGGNDTIAGGAGHDLIDGGIGNDVIVGGAGNDRIIGSLGADRLTGSLGADIFVFRSLGDSTMAVSGRDTITDFSFGQGDRIDLTAIDARSGMAGNQAFTFIGGNAFSGAAGELSARAVAGGTLISGDVNGDRVADFAILLDDPLTLGANAFLL